LNDREIGSLPGFPEQGMKRRLVSFEVTEDDVARTNILRFKPAATWGIEAFPSKRQFGIAMNHLIYRL
jgi:translation elongation factor EF-G